MAHRFIVTGGTIDKIHDPLNAEGKLIFGADSRIPEMIARTGFYGAYEVQELMLKDSLEMTDDDRAQIDEACDQAEEPQIVITHGTDAMPETARYLDANNRLARKVIVLTGAMKPYDVKNSDALANLGSAITASHLLESGVYVAMNGLVFPARAVGKDPRVGRFYGQNL